uniref:Putative secreted protein n=1 Tax=Xenopsylla cheopis TaxID=163159 RepID=A0A6M2E127_XENCH
MKQRHIVLVQVVLHVLLHQLALGKVQQKILQQSFLHRGHYRLVSTLLLLQIDVNRLVCQDKFEVLRNICELQAATQVKYQLLM